MRLVASRTSLMFMSFVLFPFARGLIEVLGVVPIHSGEARRAPVGGPQSRKKLPSEIMKRLVVLGGVR